MTLLHVSTKKKRTTKEKTHHNPFTEFPSRQFIIFIDKGLFHNRANNYPIDDEYCKLYENEYCDFRVLYNMNLILKYTQVSQTK